MFLDFFGMKEEPFGMTPDPAYLYASRTHQEALASLSLGIADTRGFFALIAEAGMGKTTLLYQLLENLRDSARTVLVSQTQCNSHEFIEYILQGLGADVKGMGLVAMHGKLNEILFEELLAGKRFVLVVDEAQNLDDSVLETVRMLSNFETHNAKLLQIILAGQPRLAAKLAQPRLSQLRQRVAVLSRLEPFTLEETGLYIEHRLKVAGLCGEPVFDQTSTRLIARESKGIPRNINNICHNSLRLSFARGLRTTTAEIVQEAVARLDMESLTYQPPAMAGIVAHPVSPAAPITPVKVSIPRSAPIAPPANAPATSKDRRAKTFLTYDAGRKISPPKWPVRSAMLAVILLSGTLLLAILGRSESSQGLRPAKFDRSSEASGSMIPGNPTSGGGANYDAAPQDMEGGQILTVMAGPQQTLEGLSLRYVGHFDSDLSHKIRNLNPDLKDPDHLEPGQLVRIPLPPGALRKVNDTGEAMPSPEPEVSGSLFARLTAFLRERK
jgi:general secretion pathway protein A